MIKTLKYIVFGLMVVASTVCSSEHKLVKLTLEANVAILENHFKDIKEIASRNGGDSTIPWSVYRDGL